MTGLLVLLTLIFAVIVAIDASILAGVFLFIGMLAATGAGQFLKRLASGTEHSRPFLLSLGSLFVLALAAGLGSLSTIHVYDISIPGALWAPLAGVMAGLLLPVESTKESGNST